jgi:hypothetical protein
METITLPNDIKVFYVKAKSYPDGIQESHEKLHSLIKDQKERRYFGLSRPEDGAIRYKAAAEELTPGEAEKLNCETLIIKKGKYTSIEINDYMKDLSGIGRAFDKLLQHPQLDLQGYCVEWYVNNQKVICMVRLDE